jgi:hypothetical protein
MGRAGGACGTPNAIESGAILATAPMGAQAGFAARQAPPVEDQFRAKSFRIGATTGPARSGRPHDKLCDKCGIHIGWQWLRSPGSGFQPAPGITA